MTSAAKQVIAWGLAVAGLLLGLTGWLAPISLELRAAGVVFALAGLRLSADPDADEWTARAMPVAITACLMGMMSLLVLLFGVAL